MGGAGARLRAALADPWGLLLGASSAGMAWALALPLPAAAGIAVLVVAAKAGAELLTRDERDVAGPSPGHEGEPDPELVPVGSVQHGWLQRARVAVRDLQTLAADAADPAGQAAAESGRDALEELHALAEQVGRVDRALARADRPGLDADRQEVARQLQADPAPGAALLRSATALQDQVAVRERLRAASVELVEAVQAGALTLEGLAARLAELATLRLRPDSDGPEVGMREAGDRLEGLRQGLAEAQALSERVLAGP